jgi:hypothetical protein
MCCISLACCCGVFTATDRTVGFRTASQMAAGSAVAGRHQPHGVAEFLELPRPVMAEAQASMPTRHVVASRRMQSPAAPQLLANDDLLVGVNAVHLENVLR